MHLPGSAAAPSQGGKRAAFRKYPVFRRGAESSAAYLTEICPGDELFLPYILRHRRGGVERGVDFRCAEGDKAARFYVDSSSVRRRLPWQHTFVPSVYQPYKSGDRPHRKQARSAAAAVVSFTTTADAPAQSSSQQVAAYMPPLVTENVDLLRACDDDSVPLGVISVGNEIHTAILRVRLIYGLMLSAAKRINSAHVTAPCVPGIGLYQTYQGSLYAPGTEQARF